MSPTKGSKIDPAFYENLDQEQENERLENSIRQYQSVVLPEISGAIAADISSEGALTQRMSQKSIKSAFK